MCYVFVYHVYLFIAVLLCVWFDGGRCAFTLDTPCPSVLKYLPLDAVDQGAWSAEIHLATQDDLQGVWLHVVLDKKAQTLLNWFGEATTLDNQEYAIRKPDYKLIAGPSVVVRIKVKYNAADVPPLITHLRLNGKTICSSSSFVKTRRTTTEKPFVSLHRKPVLTTYGEEGDVDDGLVPFEGQDQGGKDLSGKNNNKTRIEGGSKANGQGQGQGQREREEKGKAVSRGSYSDGFFSGDLTPVLYSNKKVGRKGQIPAGPRLTQDVKCGVPVKRVVPLITNGKTSIEGAWPWHIAIYTLTTKYICGGSLLTKNHVLTAAHCVTRPKTSEPADADGFRIHLGRTHLTRFNAGLQQRHLNRIQIHPHYNHSNYRNDLAVLTLNAPANYTEYVRPVCLTSDTINRNLTKDLGTVVGWGFDQSHNITELLHETQMPVVDLLTCIYSEPEVYGKLTSTNNFCAGFKNGTSVCNGDSGGGMFFEREDKVDGKRWEIRGMVSFSIASRNDLCNPHAYAVFTDVLKYRDWIKEQIKDSNHD